jgi:deoxyribodipyrimidine photo-lyase
MSFSTASAPAAGQAAGVAVAAPPAGPVIVWFRNDLRLADNPALTHAAAAGGPVLAVYVHDDASAGLRPRGGASRWWLAGSLEALSAGLEAIGGRLHVFRGAASNIIPRLAEAVGASAVVWNRRYAAAERTLDTAIKAALKAQGVHAASFNANLLNEPWEVRSKAGTPIKVFTPFWRAARERGEPPAPSPAPKALRALSLPGVVGIDPVSIGSLDLRPRRPDWAREIAAIWTPGEAAARAALGRFLEVSAKGYGDNRNRPDKVSTSRLSPHLAFGEVSPRQVWHAARAAQESGLTNARAYDIDKFLSEVGWREFSYHLLDQFPALANANFQAKFEAFPWRDDPAALEAWRRGKTGYPIVDAGMRELWRTGWMHNRVRMIAASFLVKHLLIDWRKGEEWFWDTLLDADPANNAASWQWVAGSGADAAPYFRIFAPVLQGEKFDPNGDYVRRYVPEIAKLPNDVIHKPWMAPHPVLARAGIVLGRDYPQPIVIHEAARARALAAFKSISAEAAE